MSSDAIAQTFPLTDGLAGKAVSLLRIEAVCLRRHTESEDSRVPRQLPFSGLVVVVLRVPPAERKIRGVSYSSLPEAFVSNFAGVDVYQRDLNSCSFRRNTAKNARGGVASMTNKALIAETTPRYEPWNDGLAIEVIHETSEKRAIGLLLLSVNPTVGTRSHEPE
jgi:hypothetical protein